MQNTDSKTKIEYLEANTRVAENNGTVARARKNAETVEENGKRRNCFLRLSFPISSSGFLLRTYLTNLDHAIFSSDFDPDFL